MKTEVRLIFKTPLLIITLILVIAGTIWYFMIQVGPRDINKGYPSYNECVANTKLPCKHYFIGDMGQEWRISPYLTKEECDENEKVVGFTCIVPPGIFKESRWINSVDLER